MKPQRRMILGGMALSALGVSGQAQAAEVTLRFHQLLPPQATIPRLAIDPWARKVEAESKGRIRVQVFPSMQ
ncbi:MAG: C4-dicarboxylate ABC transporter, partial [Quisquiliibacterium sp.]